MPPPHIPVLSVFEKIFLQVLPIFPIHSLLPGIPQLFHIMHHMLHILHNDCLRCILQISRLPLHSECRKSRKNLLCLAFHSSLSGICDFKGPSEPARICFRDLVPDAFGLPVVRSFSAITSAVITVKTSKIRFPGTGIRTFHAVRAVIADTASTETYISGPVRLLFHGQLLFGDQS